jgi:hypothetical protein
MRMTWLLKRGLVLERFIGSCRMNPGPDDSGFSFHSITLSLPRIRMTTWRSWPDGFPGMPECTLLFIVKLQDSSEIFRETSRDDGWYMAAKTVAHLMIGQCTPEIAVLLHDGI